MAGASSVLYRKYRPTSLEDVVGQSQVTDILAQSIKKHKLSHAYLFIGPRGTGKTSVARIFAHAVNDFKYQVEDSYLDIIEIDAASNTGVDNIRDLREKAIIAPTQGKYKVYIIDEVHMLTKSASNALLKTLEEPPAHVIFIMATTDAHKVPITISSRTQVHTFKLADPATMREHLRHIADAEKIKIDDAALDIVVKRGGGSFRDSLSLLDQVANLSTKTITAATLTTALGLPQDESLAQLIAAYAAKDHKTIHRLLQDLLNTGLKPEIIASELIGRLVARPQPETLPLLAELPAVQPPFPEAKLLLALLNSTTTPATSVAPTPATSISTPTPATATSISTPATPAATITTTMSVANAPAPTPKTTSKSTTIPAPEPAPVSNPPKPKTSQRASNFSWENFLTQVHAKSDALYSQLQKVTYRLEGQTLHLFPQQKFTKVILERPGNNKILTAELPDIELFIHDLDEKDTLKDPTISQISAIMGGVQEVKDDLPF